MIPPTISDFDTFVFELHSVEFFDGFDRVIRLFEVDESVAEGIARRLTRRANPRRQFRNCYVR